MASKSMLGGGTQGEAWSIGMVWCLITSLQYDYTKLELWHLSAWYQWCREVKIAAMIIVAEATRQYGRQFIFGFRAYI